MIGVPEESPPPPVFALLRGSWPPASARLKLLSVRLTRRGLPLTATPTNGAEEMARDGVHSHWLQGCLATLICFALLLPQAPVRAQDPQIKRPASGRYASSWVARRLGRQRISRSECGPRVGIKHFRLGQGPRIAVGPSINFTKSAVLNRSTTSDNKTLLGLMGEIDIVLFGIGPFRVGVSGTYNLMGRRDVGPFELADSQFSVDSARFSHFTFGLLVGGG